MENKKTIDGITFTVGAMLAMDAFKLKSRLIKIFAPAVGKIFTSFDLKKDFKDLDLSKLPLAEIIQELTSELDENTMDELLRKLLYNVTAVTEIGGKRIAVAFSSDFETSFNAVFGQKLFTVYPLLAFVLEVNYPDFFIKIKSFGQKMKPTVTLGLDDAPSQSEASA